MQLNWCSCNSPHSTPKVTPKYPKSTPKVPHVPPKYQDYHTALHATTGQTALYENVAPQHALWTFNISTSTWQQQHPTGQLPEPHLAHIATGLAVVNGKAYALINDPQQSKRLEVYELDLATWHWRRVPGVGSQPSCRRAASAVVIQVTGCCVCYVTRCCLRSMLLYCGRPGSILYAAMKAHIAS